MTARRRSESAQDVPIALTVLDDLIAAWGRYATWAGVVDEPVSYFEREAAGVE